MQRWWQMFLVSCLLAGLAGCPNGTTPTDTTGDQSTGGDGTGDQGGGGGDTNDGDDNTDGDDTDGGDDGGDTNTQNALNFAGDMSGSVDTVSSTDDGVEQNARKFARQDANAAGHIRLSGFDGRPLVDADGDEYGELDTEDDGTFTLDNLPVGVDFLVEVDLDDDDNPDMATCVRIPQDDGQDTGTLGGVIVDPLSTLVLARLLELLGPDFNPLDADISPAALIEQIRDAFAHLFEEGGVEQEITLDDIRGLAAERLAALFDELVPPAARRGMDMARSRLALARADDVAAVAKAAAEILVRGGFVILDNPGGLDLSFLGELENVQRLTFDEFFDGLVISEQQRPAPEAVQAAFEAPPDTYLYVSTIGEVDRNFVNNEEFMDAGHGPWFADHVLERMARLYLDRKTIRLAELYRAIVDVEIGMGARLSYFVWDPQTGGGEVFEGADGRGAPVDLEQLFAGLEEIGAGDFRPENFELVQADMRSVLRDFLQGTTPPTFERLFAGILTRRIGGVDEFARFIRSARAHLPFSRSGPSRFFVVATDDPFRSDAAGPVTADAQLDDAGRVTRVTYIPAGDGKFFVSFGPLTDEGMEVELLTRRTGKPLRDREGRPQRLEMGAETLFERVGDESFLDAFSEQGANFPGAPALRVPNFGFDPAQPADPETNPPAIEIFVLVDPPGPDGRPVRVSYDPNSGLATRDDETGEHYLMFDELTHSDGRFALINASGDLLEQTPGDYETRVTVDPTQLEGGPILPESTRFIYGIDVANPGFDPAGAPFYDDINNNDQHDQGEPTFDFREFLFDPMDWRSTRVETYYRRADDHGFVRPEQIDFGSDTPRTLDNVALVPRRLRPRLNAFRFGRPNVTINLLAAFSPPEFFNGVGGLDENTRLNSFMVLALANLAFDSVHNTRAVIDPDGPGPAPAFEQLSDAHLFVAPLGDPVLLMLDSVEDLAAASEP